MAHFAELDESGTVTQVVVVANAAITRDGVDDESLGVDLLEQITGHRRWTQTSYSGRFRGAFAGIGYQYRPDLDAFTPPCPGEDFTLDEASRVWVQN